MSFKNSEIENLSDFQTLNNNILKNYDRLTKLNEKCENLEGYYLSKLFKKINYKLSSLEENLSDLSVYPDDNNKEFRLKNIDETLQAIEKEFELIEEKPDDSNFDLNEKIIKKIEENYKILDEIEKITGNNFLINLNNKTMENLIQTIETNNEEICTNDLNENWIENDWNNFVRVNEQPCRANLSESTRKESIKNKLNAIENKIRSITTKDKSRDDYNFEMKKDKLLKKLEITEQKISELRLNLSK